MTVDVRGILQEAPLFVAQWLCPAIDVNVEARSSSGEAQLLVSASDWLQLSGEKLLKRTGLGPFGDRRETAAIVSHNVRPLMHNGRVVGRGCVLPGVAGCIAVGGFRSGFTDIGRNHDDYLAEDFL